MGNCSDCWFEVGSWGSAGSCSLAENFGPPSTSSTARSIGVGKAVAARRLGPANGLQPTGDKTQGVAPIVQAQRVGQLRVEQRHHMTPRRERAGSVLHPPVSRASLATR